MASPSTVWSARRLRTLAGGGGAAVLALAMPFVFLHRDYTAGWSVAVGSTRLDVTLADVAILAVVVTAAICGLRDGFGPLAAARVPLALTAGFLGWIVLSVAYGSVRESWYPTTTHFVTAAKFAEYAMLAFALPLIVRRGSQLVAPALVLVAWTAAATVVGLLQFAGVLDDLDETPAGRRKPSFLGYHDFATLAASALLLTAVAYVVWGPGARGRELVGAAAAGAVGMVLGGPLGAVLGTLLALVALLVVGRLRFGLDARRAAVLVGVWVAVVCGVIAIRSSAIDQGLRFLGVKEDTAETSTSIQSYAHRSLLAYLGLRIWLDQPLLGVGWQASADPPSYAPYLDDARRRFDQPEAAFPSAERRWGVQNAYVQALADLGLPGLLLLVALLATAVATAIRVALRGPPSAAPLGLAGAVILLLVAAVWNDVGLVAANPIEATAWLGVGTAATAAALARAPEAG